MCIRDSPTSEEKWSPLWPLPPSIHRWPCGRTREPPRHGREAERQELTNGWHGKRPAQGRGDRTKVDRGARKDRRRLRQGAESPQCRLLGADGDGAQGGRGFSFRQTGPRLDLPREAAGEPLLIRSEPTFRAEIRARGKDRGPARPFGSPDRRAEG